MSEIRYLHGKNINLLKQVKDNYYHSAVTDPPYGLGKEPDPLKVLSAWIKDGYYDIPTKGGFMGKEWDSFVPQPLLWKEVFRTLRPGAHLLAACGTRTMDWMMMSIRLAGFEIRDVITWHYGSGFPKSMDISKAIDKENGHTRNIIGSKGSIPTHTSGQRNTEYSSKKYDTFERKENYITEPGSEESMLWKGWGTALKPATEMWIMARKPISEKTLAKNVLKWGTGALNIDASRIDFKSDEDFESAKWGSRSSTLSRNFPLGGLPTDGPKEILPDSMGRFPSNLILDETTADIMDTQAPKAGALSPVRKEQKNPKTANVYGKYASNGDDGDSFYNDSGGASRFFYCAKPSKSERNKGLENMHGRIPPTCKVCCGYIVSKIKNMEGFCTCEKPSFPDRDDVNSHPTVKPISLMRHLVRMVTPEGGRCLDCFGGSGTTGIACSLENLDNDSMEEQELYVSFSNLRLKAWEPEPELQYSLDL